MDGRGGRHLPHAFQVAGFSGAAHGQLDLGDCGERKLLAQLAVSADQRGRFEGVHQASTTTQIDADLRAMTWTTLRHDWERCWLGGAGARIGPDHPVPTEVCDDRAALEPISWHGMSGGCGGREMSRRK